jgi:hypothetical protein
MNSKLFSGSLDLREPGAKELEKPVDQWRHHLGHALPTTDLVYAAADSFEHRGRRAQDESIPRPQEWEHGSHQGALTPVLPVELIIEIPDRAPSVPEVGIGSEGGTQPIRSLVYPSAVNIMQPIGKRRRRDAPWSGTSDQFRSKDGANHENQVSPVKKSWTE